MEYGLCHLSVIPVRLAAENTSGLVTQILYGEHYKILEQRKYWSRIRLAFDASEGWVPKNQIWQIDKDSYDGLIENEQKGHSANLVSFLEDEHNHLIPILLGSTIPKKNLLGHRYEGETLKKQTKKENIVNSSLYYLNAPELTGGRTPFGIDSSGLAQMAYKINGVLLKRTPEEQSLQGESLSFIEESEPGDLAFFDNTEGKIDHVGIILHENNIIHVNGKVRIDRLDHTGIFNNESRSYTHQLRVIKKII